MRKGGWKSSKRNPEHLGGLAQLLQKRVSIYKAVSETTNPGPAWTPAFFGHFLLGTEGNSGCFHFNCRRSHCPHLIPSPPFLFVKLKTWVSPPTLLAGMYVGAATVENSMEVPQKTKNKITIWSSNPTPGHISRENNNLKDTCTPTFIAAFFIIAKHPKCPSTNEWIKKMCYRYTMQYYSVFKKKWNFATCNNMDGPRGYYA